MEFLGVILFCAIVFGVCYAFDKGFVALFRNKIQHRSGLAVRVQKRYAAAGLILLTLGIAGMLGGELILLVCGILVALLGTGLIIFYMTFGVFYDHDGFVLLTFGKKQRTYRFSDIESQQILNASGNIVIELYLKDGTALSLQSSMEGMYPFMDAAFHGWCRQTGHNSEECTFYDPANSCWFPPAVR